MLETVRESFKSQFGKEAEILVKSPGRINLIGEHTDYNSGLVLPAAIDKYMYFLFRVNDTNEGVIYAKDLDERISINFISLAKTDIVWANYLIGLLIEFRKKDISLKGFECVFSSDIPMGAGMSSSAALECGFAEGINFIHQANFTKWEIVNMSFHSNHSFMNIYGGIMDQFSSLFGKEDNCMLLNCNDRTFEYKYIDLMDYSIVLFNTNVKHEHTSSGYNDRAAECKQIEQYLLLHNPEILSISAANITMIQEIGEDWPDNLLRRAKFVIEENDRVVQFSTAMNEGNIYRLGELLYQSHHGLQNMYEVSCSELDLLVHLTAEWKEVLGARMMGGGFGGCTINLIKSNLVEQISSSIMNKYYKMTGIIPNKYVVNISNGTSVIELY